MPGHYLVKALEICYTVEVDLESYTLVNTPMDPPSLRRIAATFASDNVRHSSTRLSCDLLDTNEDTVVVTSNLEKMLPLV
jgi:hypothetical protein